MAERGYELVLTTEAKEYLIKKGTNLDYGARPLRRALENFVEDPLSEELLKGTFQGKNKIVVDAVRNDEGKIKQLKFDSEFVPPPEEPPTEETVGVAQVTSQKTKVRKKTRTKAISSNLRPKLNQFRQQETLKIPTALAEFRSGLFFRFPGSFPQFQFPFPASNSIPKTPNFDFIGSKSKISVVNQPQSGKLYLSD